MTPTELAHLTRRLAAELGFDACGITHPGPSEHSAALDRWLDSGFHGEMRYMARQAAVRKDPRVAWAECKSIVVVLRNYYLPSSEVSSQYRVSRYAQGVDYHDVVGSALEQLGARVVSECQAGSYRVYVDAGPLPERELACRAGLGWLGKNTMLIHPRLGSFSFIGCLLTDLELQPDEPFAADRCGSCTRCLRACPTGAFFEPHVLDATRCISYLTIEARSEVPKTLRHLVGDHLFGCDICQEVCPWNQRFASETDEPRFGPGSEAWPSLDQLLRMTPEGFDARFGRTALERARLAGLQRNARVVRENGSR